MCVTFYAVSSGSVKDDFGVTVEHVSAQDMQDELVDTLARCAAYGHPLQNWDHFLSFALAPHFARTMEWAWLLFTALSDVDFEDGHLKFPVKPSTRPFTQVIPLAVEESVGEVSSKVGSKVATCNVLTLRGGATPAVDFCGIAGPARQDWILETSHQSGIHIFGLQGSRLKKLVRHGDSRYVLIKSPASMQGHFGAMIGLSKTLPRGETNGKSVFFTEDSCKISTAQPRLLIVRIRTTALKCVLIVAHAPHSGATLAEIEEYWAGATNSIGKTYRMWPKFLLTDANYRIGGHPDERVGSWQSEGMHEKSQPFVDFLAIHDIFLPSTFERCHAGERGTWLHAW
jgi:hypothetical protein